MKRGFNRREAAEYVGVSARKFDELVQTGRMPNPRMIDRRTVYDRHEIDDAFDLLPRQEDEYQKWLNSH